MREFIFTKYPVTAWKLTHCFPWLRIKYVLLHPVSEWKKARQFDITPTIAGDFCQPCSSSTHHCCTTGMTRTTSVSTVQLLICLLGLLAASVARANILVSVSSCKQSANEGILQAGHTNAPIPHRPRIPRIDTNWQIFGFVAESYSVREDLNWFAQSVVSSCNS